MALSDQAPHFTQRVKDGENRKDGVAVVGCKIGVSGNMENQG